MPGHKGKEDNNRADELERKVAETPLEASEPAVGVVVCHINTTYCAVGQIPAPEGMGGDT